MFLHFSDQAFDIFFLGYIGRDANGSTLETLLRREIVQSPHCLIDY